jgi:hypothetical protein
MWPDDDDAAGRRSQLPPPPGRRRCAVRGSIVGGCSELSLLADERAREGRKQSECGMALMHDSRAAAAYLPL